MILDPHIWLDPKLAQKEIATIAMAFEKFDNTNRVFYEKNAISLKNKLDVLDQGFRLGLLNCQQNNIVTSHAAFGYIASDYGLNQISVTGLSPDAEPSPQKMAEISQFAKTNQIKYIFFETLVSPRLADTIAGEIGAKTLVFNPLEGLTKDEQAKGWDYFSIQKENLANLKIALGCK
jgi:zinc transport system substrate-binding protein